MPFSFCFFHSFPFYIHAKTDYQKGFENMINQESIWIKQGKKTNYPTLNQDISCDVLIIGAGICGLTSAYYLRDQIRNIALIEADTIAYGASGRSTGKITSQHGCIYSKLLKKHGKEKARAYYEANEEAIESIQANIKEHEIDCGLSDKDSVVYCMSIDKTKEITEEMNALDELNIPYEVIREGEINNVRLGIRFKKQAAFDPYRYCKGLAKILKESGVHIYEHSPAATFEDHSVIVNHHKITYKHMILATQFPLTDSMHQYSVCMAPYQSSLAVYDHAEPSKDQFISVDEPTRTLRTFNTENDTMLLAGGFEHRSGIDTIKMMREMMTCLDLQFHHEPVCMWTSQDYVAADYLPLIGECSTDVYFASAFNKWGNTNGTIAGKLLTALILKQQSIYKDLFDPHRSTLFMNTKIIKENIKTANEYITSKLKQSKQLLPERDEACVTKLGTHPYGIYRNLEDELFIVDLICPHLGCTLHFNNLEKTWDCPCHGSRFNIDGTIIKAPAVSSLSCEKIHWKTFTDSGNTIK